MIATAILTMIVIWSLLYTVIPNLLLICLCLIMGVFIAVMNGHKHEGYLHIDIIAQNSRLNELNPSFKFWTVIILMFICVGSNSPVAGLFLTVMMLILTVCVGGLELHDYISLMVTPLLFLLMSVLALLFDYSVIPVGVINLPLIHGYLFVSQAAQLRAALVMSKAIGAISCLYLLNLSTPMVEIISVLRKARMPEIVIELMYLIYRYIFVLLDMYHSMKDAAKSRLGFTDLVKSIHTSGKIYSNLLARSYQKALINFDAMESRCYVGEIRFLESEKSISSFQIIVAGLSIMITLELAFSLL